MFIENENSSMKTEDATVQYVNQITKMNPFAYLSATSAKPMSTSDNNGENPENYPLREILEDEKTIVQGNHDSSTKTESTKAHDENLINGNEAIGDNPVTSGQPMNACNEESENSLMRENSTTGDTVNEKKLYNKINNMVKNFANDNKKRVVSLWYWIGTDIDNYFEMDYGKSEMKRISDNTRIGISTLYKAVQFANKFTDDDLKWLLEKNYISFRLIVESFPLGRLQALQVFETSNNAKEAQHKINEIKQRETTKNTTTDDGADLKVPDSEKAPDTDTAANTVPEETGKEAQPADQVSAPTEPQSADNQAEVNQKQGSQDVQGAPVAGQPSSTENTVTKKHPDTETDINKKVSEPDFFGKEDSPDSFSYLFETMNKIGTKLVNTSVEKPPIGDLREIIQDTMKELTDLLVLVPEATCAHSGVTLSAGAEWEFSCQSAALPV